MNDQKILLVKDEKYSVLTIALGAYLEPTQVFDVDSGTLENLNSLCNHLMNNEYDTVVTPSSRDSGVNRAIDTIRAQHLGKIVGYGIKLFGEHDLNRVNQSIYDGYINCNSSVSLTLKDKIQEALQ